MNIILWIARIVAATIMLQTLYFKFTASEESVFIFTALGMEPYGRIATGLAELAASVLLLIPATSIIGAILSLGLMGGAIFFHLTVLGIEVMNDNGLLFFYAMVVTACSFFTVFINRKFLMEFIRKRSLLQF